MLILHWFRRENCELAPIQHRFGTYEGTWALANQPQAAQRTVREHPGNSPGTPRGLSQAPRPIHAAASTMILMRFLHGFNVFSNRATFTKNPPLEDRIFRWLQAPRAAHQEDLESTSIAEKPHFPKDLSTQSGPEHRSNTDLAAILHSQNVKIAFVFIG